jgi:uncharacterized protein YbjT (DUF2867 family)
MSSSPTIGVAGANGRLGKHVINALTSPMFRPNYNGVIALVRDFPQQSTLDEWKKAGVEVRIYNENSMIESLKGIDALINVYVSVNFLALHKLK